MVDSHHTSPFMHSYGVYRCTAFVIASTVLLLLFCFPLPDHKLSHAYVKMSALYGRFERCSYRSDKLGATFIIGVTTVSRHSASYLNNTLHSLQCALASDDAQPTVLIFNGDIPPNRHMEFENLWKQPNMQQFMRQGLMLIGLGELHKELQAAKAAGGLPQTHGDPPDRVWWRSKQNLDTAYLIEAALNVSQGEEYYLQLEDDVKLTRNLLSKLDAFIRKLKQDGKTADLVTLFGDGGLTNAVAIAHRVGFLRDYVAYLRANFYQSPYDWTLAGFVGQHGLSVDLMIPNLVQHTGITSSLKGKVQPIVSSSFNMSEVC